MACIQPNNASVTVMLCFHCHCFELCFLLCWASLNSIPTILPLCSSTISTFSLLHLVDESLVFEWCAFCSMICSVVSLLLPGLSLPSSSPPGSQPTLTYVFASDLLLHKSTMLKILLNSSPTLLVTPRDPPQCPTLSVHPTTPLPPRQDFLGQIYCTLGEIVGSPASRLEKPLGWVLTLLLERFHFEARHLKHSTLFPTRQLGAFF